MQKILTSKVLLYSKPVTDRSPFAGKSEKRHLLRQSHRCCLINPWSYFATQGACEASKSKAIAILSTPQSDEFLCRSISTILMVRVGEEQNTSLASVSTVDEGMLEYIVSYTFTTSLSHPRLETTTPSDVELLNKMSRVCFEAVDLLKCRWLQPFGVCKLLCQ